MRKLHVRLHARNQLIPQISEANHIQINRKLQGRINIILRRVIENNEGRHGSKDN